MSFIVVGTSYKYSPIELREKISFSRKKLKDALNFLREGDILRSAVILSTCNRVEIYASVEDSKEGIREIENFISQFHNIEKRRLSPYFYIYENKKALKHLFSVACGLDSLILGETQILGQVKASFIESEGVSFVDEFLHELFYSALSFARRIHTETKIAEGKISVGSVAIDFIKQRLGSLWGSNILIIGVGKVTELVLRYLENENPSVIFLANKNFEKANDLANRIGAKAVKFDELRNSLTKSDAVITATASPHFIIKKEHLEEELKHEILIIDLAVPRDVDPRVKDIKKVNLFTLEDLDTVINSNIEQRSKEAEKIKDIINIEVEKLWEKFIDSEPEPVLLH